MARLMPNGKQQYFDTNGDPLNGGKVYTYSAGTSTPKDTYTTYAGTVANANPVILDSRGEATIFWNGAYKIVLKDSSDNTIWTVDNVDTAVTATDVSYASTTLSSILLSHSVYVVDTINDLRSVDKTKFTYVFAAGYYKKRDGGGGMYAYDSTDTTSSDNGGTIIVASDSGRWKLLHNGEVDLAQFGAKPYEDYPTTDNTPFIQAAVDACDPAVTFEPKIKKLKVSNWYLLKTTLTVSNGVQIEGVQEVDFSYVQVNGKAHDLFPCGFYFGGTSAGKLETQGCISKLMICPDDYDLQGDGTMINNASAFTRTTSPIHVSITSSTDSFGECIIDKCMIVGFSAYGITVNSSTNYGVIKITDTLIDCYQGISANTSDYYDLIIENVIIPNYLGDNAGVGPQKIINGINITGAGENRKVYIKGGYIKSENPIKVASVAGADVLIEGTRLDLTNDTVYVGYAIYIDNANVCTAKIIGNSITTPGGAIDNIYINNGSYVIKDNYLDHRIYLNTGADYGVVQGNSEQTVEAVSTAVLKKCSQNFENATHTPSDFTWTPSLKLAGSATDNTLGSVYAVYRVIDNCVYYHAYFQITALRAGAAAADDVTIDGLPFTSAAGDASAPVGSCTAYYYSGGAAITGGIHGTILPSGTIITMYQGATSGTMTALEKQDLAANMYLGISGFYFIDR